MSIDIIKTGLLNQLARNNLPAQNRSEIQSTYDMINSNPHHSNFNNLGAVSNRMGNQSSFIHCEDMARQLAKFAGFDNFLGFDIGDAFGDDLGLIAGFKSLAQTCLDGMSSLISGLDGIEAAAGPLIGLLKTASGMISSIADNPCAKEVAQNSYRYLSPDDKSQVDLLTNISNPVDRGTKMNQMMKQVSVGKFL